MRPWTMLEPELQLYFVKNIRLSAFIWSEYSLSLDFAIFRLLRPSDGRKSVQKTIPFIDSSYFVDRVQFYTPLSNRHERLSVAQLFIKVNINEDGHLLWHKRVFHLRHSLNLHIFFYESSHITHVQSILSKFQSRLDYRYWFWDITVEEFQNITKTVLVRLH